MQRSLPVHHSLMLMCLGLSLWIMVQSWMQGTEGDRLSSVTAMNSGQMNSGRMNSDRMNLNWMKSGSQTAVLPAFSPLWTLGGVLWAAEPAMEPRGLPNPQGRIVVDLSDRKLYLYKKKKLAAEYPVAIGHEVWQTPQGRYLIGDMQRNPAWEHPLTGRIVPPGPDNPLGAAWISFWSNGGYSFGLHGTTNEALIGEAVSHGCVRLRNADILALYDVVKPGWLLEVQP